MTSEAARASMEEGEDDDPEGDDATALAIGESMEPREIESWADLDLPKGYELQDEDDREEYSRYLRTKPGNA